MAITAAASLAPASYCMCANKPSASGASINLMVELKNSCNDQSAMMTESTRPRVRGASSRDRLVTFSIGNPIVPE